MHGDHHSNATLINENTSQHITFHLAILKYYHLKYNFTLLIEPTNRVKSYKCKTHQQYLQHQFINKC